MPTQSWCLINNWCNTRYLSKIHPPLQKTFLSCKIKNEKCTKNYEAAIKGSSPKLAVHKIDNKIRNILERQPQRRPLPPKRQKMRPPSPAVISQVNLIKNRYIKEKPWMATSKYNIYNKSWNTIYTICAYLQVKHCYKL